MCSCIKTCKRVLACPWFHLLFSTCVNLLNDFFSCAQTHTHTLARSTCNIFSNKNTNFTTKCSHNMCVLFCSHSSGFYSEWRRCYFVRFLRILCSAVWFDYVDCVDLLFCRSSKVRRIIFSTFFVQNNCVFLERKHWRFFPLPIYSFVYWWSHQQ